MKIGNRGLAIVLLGLWGSSPVAAAESEAVKSPPPRPKLPSNLGYGVFGVGTAYQKGGLHAGLGIAVRRTFSALDIFGHLTFVQGLPRDIPGGRLRLQEVGLEVGGGRTVLTGKEWTLGLEASFRAAAVFLRGTPDEMSVELPIEIVSVAFLRGGGRFTQRVTKDVSVEARLGIGAPIVGLETVRDGVTDGVMAGVEIYAAVGLQWDM